MRRFSGADGWAVYEAALDFDRFEEYMPSLPLRPATGRGVLSVVIPCFNEERTLAACVERLRAIQTADLALEILIIDDASTDGSGKVADDLAALYPDIRVVHQPQNLGKGAAIRVGVQHATGDFLIVQDADLEYHPRDIPALLGPLRDGRADVVLGSRFKGQGPHRVLFFWHYLGNTMLTLLSNLFTDLNLTDMECGYKCFRRDVLQQIAIEEDRFGFEPEIIAKLAHSQVRIYEMAVSYEGRTYAEGKKITWRDGLRALYSIFRYNAHHLPAPLQFIAYLAVGGLAALVNVASFGLALAGGLSLTTAVVIAFALAMTANYLLCIALVFRHNARWNTPVELGMYLVIVTLAGALDVGITRGLVGMDMAPMTAKTCACGVGVVYNFLARRYAVF